MFGSGCWVTFFIAPENYTENWIQHNVLLSEFDFYVNLSLANSNFKPLPAVETIHDNDFSIGGYWYQRLFRSLNSLESRHSSPYGNDARCNSIDNRGACSPGQSQSKRRCDPIALAGHCQSVSPQTDATSAHAAKTWSLRFPILVDSLSIAGIGIVDRCPN